MTIERKEYNIKMPSSGNVNVKSIWGVLKIIAKTGKVFLEDNLLEVGSPVNKKNLFRVLSYIKYLGILHERREKEIREGKEISVQRWHQQEGSNVADLFYNLKGGREEEARKILSEIVKSHDLFQGIKGDLLSTNPAPTEIDLEHYLREKSPGKSPAYYKYSAKFIISFLGFNNLVVKEGNSFKLIDEEEKEENEEKPSNPKEEPLKTDLGDNKYVVRITGKDLDLSFALNDASDIGDVETILEIINRKIS